MAPRGDSGRASRSARRTGPRSTDQPTHDIIVVGGSAGGLETLLRVLRDVPDDIPASIFIVLHVSPDFPSQLPAILGKVAKLPAAHALDGMPIERGRIYLAPPDRHLLVEPSGIRVVRGPKENRYRPAIDPLFRSAAWAFGPRVIGVVLSGLLDDGAAGLWAIKTCGGLTIVQDPLDALYPDMPRAALDNVGPDRVLPAGEIAPALSDLARAPVKAPAARRPNGMKVEIESTKMNKNINDMGQLGRPSAFTCPACHGALWELEDGHMLRFRCHVGHGFSGESLLAEQADALEDALYSALRALEEKAATSRRLGERMGQRLPYMRIRYEDSAKEAEKNADIVRRLLLTRTNGGDTSASADTSDLATPHETAADTHEAAGTGNGDGTDDT